MHDPIFNFTFVLIFTHLLLHKTIGLNFAHALCEKIKPMGTLYVLRYVKFQHISFETGSKSPKIFFWKLLAIYGKNWSFYFACNSKQQTSLAWCNFQKWPTFNHLNKCTFHFCLVLSFTFTIFICDIISATHTVR